MARATPAGSTSAAGPSTSAARRARASSASRRYYLCGGQALDVVVPVAGDATANEWQWGEDPGDWLPTVLAALGDTPRRVGGLDVGKQYRVPRPLVPALLTRALAHFGGGDGRLHDAR